MEIPPALLQFLGSLAAVLALAGLAWWLQLGPERGLTSEAEAREAASDVLEGFEPVAVAVDREGRGALLRDGAGRIMLLRPHGAHFSGRLLGPRARASVEGDALLIDTAERGFGGHRLRIDEAAAWAQAIDALNEAHNA